MHGRRVLHAPMPPLTAGAGGLLVAYEDERLQARPAFDGIVWTYIVVATHQLLAAAGGLNTLPFQCGRHRGLHRRYDVCGHRVGS